MKKILSLIVVAIFWAANLQAATISFDPLNSSVGINDMFYVDIIGTDFPETQGGGVNLFYDQNILEVHSIDIDPGLWNFVNNEGTIDNLLGTVSDILVSAINPGGTDPKGDFIIATIEFKAVGYGTSGLSLTESDVNPWASNGELLEHDYVVGSAAVVPLPSAVWLFSSGLFGLIGLSRRDT